MLPDASDRPPLRLLGPLLALGLLAAVVVGRWQAGDRSPLVWDEAARLRSAVDLQDPLRGFDVGGVVDWIGQQTFYPFGSSIGSGIALALGADVLTSAWAPALVAFVLAGVLGGLLAWRMGTGVGGALLAAAAVWTTPLLARLTGGNFTEPLGLCALLGLLVLLARMQARADARAAIGAGLMVGLATAVKYDYGLLCAATLGLSELLRLHEHRTLASLKVTGIAAASAVFFIGVQFVANASGKLEGASDFIGDNSGGSVSAYGRAFSGGSANDFLYYPELLFGDPEVGLSFLSAVAGLAAIAFVAWRWRGIAAARPAVIAIGLWWVMYSMAGTKFPRFAGLVLPVIAVLAVVVAVVVGRELRARTDGWRWAGTALPALVALGLVLQVPSMRTQFFFLEPDEPASQAVAFVREALAPSGDALLYVGPSNELSPHLVTLEWNDATGRRNGPVQITEEKPPEERQPSWDAMVAQFAPQQVLVVQIGKGGRLDTSERATRWQSQPDFARIALADERFRRVREMTTDRGRLRLTVLRRTA